MASPGKAHHETTHSISGDTNPESQRTRTTWHMELVNMIISYYDIDLGKNEQERRRRWPGEIA